MNVFNRNKMFDAVKHFSGKSERLSPKDSEHCCNIMAILTKSIEDASNKPEEVIEVVDDE